MTIIYFILTLFLLITVHEYGHFVFARLFGVKVLTFSFGFGKKLLSWTSKKGTQYVWSILPLGGYVNLLGMNEEIISEDDKKNSFKEKSILVKLAILMGGSIFNFLFAFVAFVLVFMIGVHSMAPIVTKIIPNTPAFEAKFLPDTEIIAINDKLVRSWRDAQVRLIPYIQKDRVIKVELQSIKTGKKFVRTISLKNLDLSQKNTDFLTGLGVVPFVPVLPPIVETVLQKSPAYNIIQPGDEIIAINQKPIRDWLEIVQIVKNNPDAKLDITVLRQQKNINFNITVGHKKVNAQTVGWIGLASKPVAWPTNWLRLEKYNLHQSIVLAGKQTFTLSMATLNWIWSMVIGNVSLSNLSGPIGIAQGAQASGNTGMVYYILFLALVSISLGVLNLLPIPILDGGHIVYCIVELIRGKPLTNKTKNLFTYIGIIFLVAISVVALNNDLNHYFLTE